MTYITKIDYLLDVDDFMQCSKQVEFSISIGAKQRKRSLTKKECLRVINNQIRRKVTNSRSVTGVCNCPSGMLCDHRKKYLKAVLGAKKEY